MKDDPEGVNDTLAGENSAAPTEPGGLNSEHDGVEGAETLVSSPQHLEASDDETRTDSFIRWLPTMWLSHRRRKELVTRSSSDGVDFAVYASSSRPVASREPVGDSDKLQVDSKDGFRADPDGRGSLDAAERAAPTVVTRRRPTGRRRTLALASVVGLAAAAVSVAVLASRPVGTQSPPAAAAVVATARAAGAPTQPAESAGQTDRAAPSLQTASAIADRSPPKTTAGEGETRAEPAFRELRSKLDARPRALQGVESVSTANTRATSTSIPSSVPAKEQYFEAP
jgi:hypothetical protein